MTALRRSVQLKTTDREYIAGHRFMYGDIGERVATAAILIRDTLMRPGFVLPLIRLAPIAPYGKCMALSGNGGSLIHVPTLPHGIWLYLHRKWYRRGEQQMRKVDEVTMHELLHNELMQFGLDPKHKGEPWAARCQEIKPSAGAQRADPAPALNPHQRPRDHQNTRRLSAGFRVGQMASRGFWTAVLHCATALLRSVQLRTTEPPMTAQTIRGAI